MSVTRFAGAVVCACLMFLAPGLAKAAGPGGRNRQFPFQGGAAIYTGVCQGCHMPNAKGAVGAGDYPALADDKNLQVAGYPIAVVVNGQKAMPPFGRMLSDRQVADVVNYVRSHFGNAYKDKVTPKEMESVR